MSLELRTSKSTGKIYIPSRCARLLIGDCLDMMKDPKSLTPARRVSTTGKGPVYTLYPWMDTTMYTLQIHSLSSTLGLTQLVFGMWYRTRQGVCHGVWAALINKSVFALTDFS